MFRALIVLVMLLTAFTGLGSHVMGGEITYKHLGNANYQFELVFYRDCNGADVNAVHKPTGDTALHAAARTGARGIYEALVKAGASAGAVNGDGQTPQNIFNAAPMGSRL